MQVLEIQVIKNYLEVQLESDPKDFDYFYSNVVFAESKKIKINGFRKGKVPIEIAKKYLNQDAVYETVLQHVVSKTISKFKVSKELEKHDVFEECVKNELIEFKQNERTLIFKSHFETKPTVVLGDYKKIETIYELKNNNSKSWLKQSKGPIEKNDSLFLKVYAFGKDQKSLNKYSIDVVEVDLENTKLPKELIKEVLNLEINKEKKVTINLEKEDIDFYITLLSVQTKHEVNEDLIKEFKNPDVKTPEDVYKIIAMNIDKQNEELKKNIIGQWCSGTENQLSYIPEHNLKLESEKTLKSYVHRSKNLNFTEENLQTIFKNIFVNNLNKLKTSCVLQDIGIKENILCNEEEKEQFLKKIKDNNNFYNNVNVKEIIADNEELIKGFVIQEKCFAYLKDQIIFSN